MPKRLILLAATFVLIGGLAFTMILPATGHMSHGFIGRYTAAKLLVEGRFGPQVYEFDWFVAQVQANAGQPIIEIFTPNLPTLALLTVPLVWLPAQLARDVWIWLNFVILAGAVVWLGASLPGRLTGEWRGGILAISLLTLAPALSANFQVGQVYVLLLLCYVLALRGLLRERPWLVGLAFGLALVFKTSGLAFWLLLLGQRRWRALAWGGLTVLLTVLLSLPWIGLDTWLAYPQAVRQFGNSGARAVTAYQATPNFFAHLFLFDPVWNLRPVAHQPLLAWLLPLLITAGALVVTFWLGWRSGSQHTARFFAALMPLNVILLPVAESYHFGLMLIPLYVLSIELIEAARLGEPVWFDWALLLAAGVLLAAPGPSTGGDGGGWLALLAYPRLYGGWLVWVVAVRRLAARPQPEAALQIR
ncbi:MAG: DUF2029 domain-containing protein [Anaerolineae bacterium]|nr:DUF2029 domain-containing protein [Anaerolineae bacterium]